MTGPASVSKTLELIERVEAGDREAAFDLARLYRPDSTDDFVRFVVPDRIPPPWLFDALCDAYTAWLEDLG